MKRLLLLFAVSLLALTAAFAGGKTESTQTATATGQLSSTPVTLRVATFDNWYAPKSFALNLPVFQELEKQTNVKIQWEVTPPSDWGSVVSTMFAAGRDLPDILFGWYDYITYYKPGLIIDLTDIINKNAPNLQRLFKDLPEVKGMITEADGKILRVPQVYMTVDIQPNYAMRQDWLDKVGMKIPTNMDEFVKVLKAFRDKDPNGNGKQDEIPFAMEYASDWSWYPAASFGLHSQYYFNANSAGKVEFVPITPGYKDFLKFMKMLYSEKLLVQDFVSINWEKEDALRNADVLGTLITFMSNIDTYNRQQPQARWTGFGVLPGKDPKPYQDKRAPADGDGVVSANSKNPVVAVKWLDYLLYSPQGVLLSNYGVEGLSYKMVSGKPAFTDFVMKNPDGMSGVDALRSIGAFHNLPYIQDAPAFLAFSTDVVKGLNTRTKTIMGPVFPVLDLAKTDQEYQAFKTYWTDLKTYLDEMFAKFVIGQVDIDAGWDTFVKTSNSLGADKLAAASQTIYNRWISAGK